MDKQSFGIRVQELRQQKGWSMEQLGKQIGVSKGMVSFIETGLKYPSFEVLAEMSRVLNTSVDYLINGGDNRRILDVTGLPEEYIDSLCLMLDVMRRERAKN